jgi:phage shock protein PspC (stress-responsive transcriptional regulator)
VDLSAPAADSEPTPVAKPTPPPTAPPDRIFGGVAALIAWRLGLDPLWVRIAFVLLALAGGVGLVVYAGLWLLLIAGPQRGSDVLRVLGGAVLVAGVPLLLSAGDFDIITGPVAVVLLLVGLALALWQPRNPRRPAIPASVATVHAPLAHPSTAPDAGSDATPVTGQPVAPPAPRPAPSPLGRAVLGLAIAVAAAGALIDQANGGRLHPEQWLGAGAVVCGLGLLVAAFVGRGRWLIVPALVFAAAGYAGGQLARIGIPFDETFADHDIHIGERSPGGSATLETGFGTIDVNVDGTPADTYMLDARAAFGTIRIVSLGDVAVLIEPDVDDDGEVRLDGIDVAGPIRLGPEGQEPAVVIDARVGSGTVEITTSIPPLLEPVPRIDRPIDVDRPVDLEKVSSVADAVDVTDDGWFVLAGDEAVINRDDVVVVGETTSEPGGVTVIFTSMGDFRLLPRGLLVTPWSEVLDLHAIRSSLGVEPEPSTTMSTTTISPSTTNTTATSPSTSTEGPP